MRHKHRCATKGCPHFFVCTQRDCRIDWQCPTCDDDERFNEFTAIEQQQQKERVSAQNI